MSKCCSYLSVKKIVTALLKLSQHYIYNLFCFITCLAQESYSITQTYFYFNAVLDIVGNESSH